MNTRKKGTGKVIHCSTYESHAVVMRVAIQLAWLLELMLAPVPRQIPSQADQHLPQRWVHVEIELPVYVVVRKLAEMRLVPAVRHMVMGRVEYLLWCMPRTPRP